jgi:hypothetical protein
MTTEMRVQKLERELRWTRFGVAIATVAISCVVLVGAGQDSDKVSVVDELRTKKLVLVNQDSEVVGEIASRKSGGYLFVGGPGKGAPRVTIHAYGAQDRFGSASVDVSTDIDQDAIQKMRVERARLIKKIAEAASTPEGKSGNAEVRRLRADLAVLVSKLRTKIGPRIRLSVSSGGGVARGRASPRDLDSARVTVSSGLSPRIALAHDATASGVTVFDDRGKARLAASVGKAIGPCFTVLDEKSGKRAVLGRAGVGAEEGLDSQDRPESTLALFGSDGSLLHRLPR